MEPRISANSKRSYHAIMGPIVEDVNLLSKKRKKLFEDINIHIDSLIKLVKDTGDKLDNDGQHKCLNIDPNGINSNKGITIEPSTDDSQSETSSMSERDRLELKQFVNTVKSLDIHKRINKTYKDFNNEFNNIGKSLFGSRSCDTCTMFETAKLDEKLLCRMIGMHLLHYGMFDVYEMLRAESIALWGENNRSIINEIIIVAYRTLHGLLDNIKSCNTEPVIDWINRQYETSALHIERFNEILINLYKIRFLKGLFNNNNQIDGKFSLISNDFIDDVKASGISTLWRMHNDEIGKLISQVLLGQNVPTPAEFDDLKNSTSKIFIRLFCETGVLIKKPDTWDDSNDYPSSDSDYTKDVNNENIPTDIIKDGISLINKKASISTSYVYRRWEDDTNDDLLSKHFKSKCKSWLHSINDCTRSDISNYTLPEFNHYSLPKKWLDLRTYTDNTRRHPRMAYRYLNSESLKTGNALNFINCKLRNKDYVPPYSSLSKSALINILSDPETACRQNITIDKDLLNYVPQLIESQRCEEESSLLRYDDGSDSWQSGRQDRNAAVLIASGHDELDETFLADTTHVTSDDSLQRSPTTFSLTVFAGSSIFRDSRLSSQILDSDLISQGLLNVSSGSRIRIRFPNRDDTGESHRRDQLATTSDVDDLGDVLDVEGEGGVLSEGELTSHSLERSNVTLRDILRMIMRGLRSESSQPTAVVRLRGSRAGQSIDDLRTSLLGESISSSSAEKDTSSPPNKVPIQKKCLIQTIVPEDPNYIRVHLPYESPLSVVTCAGHVTYPYLLDVLKVLFKEQCEVSSKVGTWLKSNQQLPVESDLGPVFHFHSYLSCAVSKDQTNSENLPIMLPCGHVICKICHDRLSGKRRKRQFKCPMCPTIVEPNQTMELYLD